MSRSQLPRSSPAEAGLAARPLIAASLALLILLAACGGGAPLRDSEGPPAATSGTTGGKSTPTVQKRGGAYYKDDGPGELIPDKLDEIPDAQPRSEPLHRFANSPYVVLGRSYVPNRQLQTMRQRGVGSWYGKKFHGQKTSIGEVYDMFAMTAAHPTLALPSYARVTNLNNGRSVIVRVNDRGPFHAGRIIDLSYAAAHRLGYVNDGSAPVEVEAILPSEVGAPVMAQAPAATGEPVPAPSEADDLSRLMARLSVGDALPRNDLPNDMPRGVFIQLGAFSNADNAESLRAHLLREFDWLNENIQVYSNDSVHRVQLGPYASRAAAEKIAERIRSNLGYKPAFVVR